MNHASNPAWADKLADRFCDGLQRLIKKHGLPSPLVGATCSLAETLGEGTYGAALDTDDPNWVIKFTTDSSEAHVCQVLAHCQERCGIDLRGIVGVAGVYALPAKLDDWPVFLIWREKAIEIGLDGPGGKDFDACEMEDFLDIIDTLHETSDWAFALALKAQSRLGHGTAPYWKWMRENLDDVNSMIQGHSVRGADPFAKQIFDTIKLILELQENRVGGNVGATMRSLAEYGILLCDVHAHNVGVVQRGKCKSKQWVITDPGLGLILQQKLSKIDIPLLKE